MRQFAIALVWSMGLVGAVHAASEEVDSQRTAEMQCPALLTEAECRAHQETLLHLSQGRQRDEYLARHAAQLEERRKSCACTMARNGIGLLRY